MIEIIINLKEENENTYTIPLNIDSSTDIDDTKYTFGAVLKTEENKQVLTLHSVTNLKHAFTEEEFNTCNFFNLYL